MTRLAIACYALAACALGLSLQVGWAAALVAVAALAASVVLVALEHRRSAGLMDTAQGLGAARSEAAEAREDVKRLRGELHGALERLAKQPRGY